MKEEKTIRIIVPQWMGGVNSNYYFGAQLLAFIVPPSSNEETFTINVETPDEVKIDFDSSIVLEENQLKTNESLKELLKKEEPDRAIILGGDCSISLIPFDYFKSRYKNTGIIWLDSHPDISTPDNSNHNHEMVLANLLGFGENAFTRQISQPYDLKKVIYVGLVENPTGKLETLGLGLSIETIKPEEIESKFTKVLDWLKNNNIEKVCVHLDLDVLSPLGFRSLTSSKPYQSVEEYGAAVGELDLYQIIEFLNKINLKAEIVCLSIAELVPWDAINLRNALAKLPIFEANK